MRRVERRRQAAAKEQAIYVALAVWGKSLASKPPP
jgi:hypothetical protein